MDGLRAAAGVRRQERPDRVRLGTGGAGPASWGFGAARALRGAHELGMGDGSAIVTGVTQVDDGDGNRHPNWSPLSILMR